jgi:hypothetical protein
MITAHLEGQWFHSGPDWTEETQCRVYRQTFGVEVLNFKGY